MKALAYSENYDEKNVQHSIRLDYAEQNDDTGGITLEEETSYGRVKEPRIRNIIVKFNGDRESFELFIKSLLSDYLHAAEVEKSSAEQEADK
jgi:hypothetical protein